MATRRAMGDGRIRSPGRPLPKSKRGTSPGRPPGKRRARLTHLDDKGHARVVDVGDKPETRRSAEARAIVHTSSVVARAVLDGEVPKGDVAAVARLAGILGAKKTPELVPLCHTVPLTHVAVDLEISAAGRIEITVRTECVARTGVEMEALTGAALAALAVYDMIKGMDRAARIGVVELVAKSGGRSGTWMRGE